MQTKFWNCFAAMTLVGVMVSAVPLVAQKNNNHQHHHYQLIDLGTFGGPASFVNPSFNVFSSLSSNGITVGSSATATPTNPYSDFFVCGGLDGVVPNVFHAFAWQDGSVVDLGSLAGSGYCSIAGAVNALGEIAGTSENGVIDPLFGVNQVRAVLWEKGVLTDLGTFGGNSSSASSINGRGQVVGFALNTISDPVSMADWQIGGSTMGTQTRAFVWDKHNGMQDLGTLGGPDAVGGFVNNSGQVVGFSYTDSEINSTTGLPTTHPFLWKNGKMTDLGTLGGTLAGSAINGLLGGLNNNGQVVGLSTLTGDQGCTGSLNGCVFDPFLWSKGKMTDLYSNSSGGNPLTANAINDAGWIVGAAAFPSQSYDAYIWNSGVTTDLGHLSGDCDSEAWAINSNAQVVAISFSCTSNNARAFLWENGSAVDLNTLIPPSSSLQVVWPLAINDGGEIDGVGWPSDCLDDLAACGHAFLLIPCDDNHPGIEGCDYSTVEAGTVPSGVPTPRKASDRVPLVSRLRHNNRFHFPAIGPRN